MAINYSDYELRVTSRPSTPGYTQWEVDQAMGSIIQGEQIYQEYQGARLEIIFPDLNGIVDLQNQYQQISYSALRPKEREDFCEYLRLQRRANRRLGPRWAFFRGGNAGKLKVLGPNISIMGNELEDNKAIDAFLLEACNPEERRPWPWLLLVPVALALAAAALFVLRPPFVQDWLDRIFPDRSPSYAFYSEVFPDLVVWKRDGNPQHMEIATAFLDPAYVSDLLRHTNADSWRLGGEGEQARLRAIRLILYDYFNYNGAVKAALDKYGDQVKNMSVGALRKQYSFDKAQDALPQNVLYYEVGDLTEVQIADIASYLKKNYIVGGYRTITETEVFQGSPIQRDVMSKLLTFIEQGVNTYTSVYVTNPTQGVEWHLVTGTIQPGKDFAVFFHGTDSTPVPRDVAGLLSGRDVTWFKVSAAQAGQLKLDQNAVRYFSGNPATAPRLKLLQQRLNGLRLEEVRGIQVGVRQKLLLGEGDQRYGLQTRDPILALVLANLLDEDALSRASALDLDRNVVPIHVTAVQLSRAYGGSDVVTGISGPKLDVLDLFSKAQSFEATFADGKKVTFYRLSENVFSPYAFDVSTDAISFFCNRDIDQMVIPLGDRKFQVQRSKNDFIITSLTQ